MTVYQIHVHDVGLLPESGREGERKEGREGGREGGRSECNGLTTTNMAMQ